MPKKKPDYAAQPSVAAILKLISTKRGATAAEIARKRGLQPHTARAVISRLGSKAGIKVEREQDERRGTVYRAARR